MNDLPEDLQERILKARAYKGTVSRLRKEITKLTAISDIAIDILYRRMSGEKVDKELVADAKWLLTTIDTLFQTAIKEEQIKSRVRMHKRETLAGLQPTPKQQQDEEEDEEPEQEDTEEEEHKPRFSLKMPEGAPKSSLTDDEF